MDLQSSKRLRETSLRLLCGICLYYVVSVRAESESDAAAEGQVVLDE